MTRCDSLLHPLNPSSQPQIQCFLFSKQFQSLRSTNHSPLDSTGSAAESNISSAVNDESNHAISNPDDTHKEVSGKDSDDGSNAMLNENSPDEVAKPSAIDASSTNEDEDSGKMKTIRVYLCGEYNAIPIPFICRH